MRERSINPEASPVGLRRVFLGVCCFALLLGGCADRAGYREPISTFQDASSVVVGSARTYLTQLNKTERDAYIRRQANHNQPIVLNEVEKAQSFSPEQIAMRLDALDVLAGFGALLGQLANSDAPERISGSAADLGDALEKLSGHVSQFATGSADNKFVGAVGPVTKLVGEVTRIAVEKKIQQALDRAILAGDGPVRDLIKAIGADLALAYERKRNALSERRVDYIDAYGDTLGPARGQERRRAAEDLIGYLDTWEAFPLSNPEQGLAVMADAYSSLVTYAKSSKTPTDLAGLADQMELFAARARRVGTAVQELNKNF